MEQQPHIYCRTEGQVGRITLTRPEALNALSHDMAIKMERALLNWAKDEAISCVLVDAAGDRAFCAGGDLAAFYQQAKTRDYQSGRAFWRDEYRLNNLIAHYPKPYIAIMAGIVMGGGVGLSAHGSHRIVTETTKFALPECAIGLIPDVGSSLYLAKAPKHLGEFIGLTGYHLKAADVILSGFADYYLPTKNISDFISDLVRSNDISCLERWTEDAGQPKLEAHIEAISKVFSADSVSEILERAEIDTDPVIQQSVKLICRNSPISLGVTFLTIREVRRNPTVENALACEYRFVSRVVEQGDFVEGIRATIIDKDKMPNWKYKQLADVPASLLEELTSPAVDGDLTFDN